ncbi:hypothetical protein PMAYCL1PPCAC_01094, partial [Pristionchus mayeri]
VAANNGKTGTLFGTFVMVSQLTASTLIIIAIWIRNTILERRLKMSIDHNHLITEYTIGKKFQVQENLKSFKFIRNMIGSVIPLGAIVQVIATYNLGKSQDLQSFLRSFVDLLTTGSQLLAVIIGIFSLPEWRADLAQRFRQCKHRHRHKVPEANQPTNDETDTYFNQLTEAWNKP